MSKSLKQIMREISPETLQRELVESLQSIDKLFADTCAQISRQDNAAWSEFPARLMAHSDTLKKEAERLAKRGTSNN